MNAIPHSEFLIVLSLIQAAEQKNLLISVYDGEEWVVRKESSADKVREFVGHSEEELLMFHTPGARGFVGCVHLVYGNGPEEVICNYDDNAPIGELIAFANSVRPGTRRTR